jgi:hypothetical protein
MALPPTHLSYIMTYKCVAIRRLASIPTGLNALAAFERARDNVVRVQELLADDGLEMRYSTLIRWAREASLSSPPRRAGE